MLELEHERAVPGLAELADAHTTGRLDPSSRGKQSRVGRPLRTRICASSAGSSSSTLEARSAAARSATDPALTLNAHSCASRHRPAVATASIESVLTSRSTSAGQSPSASVISRVTSSVAEHAAASKSAAVQGRGTDTAVL